MRQKSLEIKLSSDRMQRMDPYGPQGGKTYAELSMEAGVGGSRPYDCPPLALLLVAPSIGLASPADPLGGCTPPTGCQKCAYSNCGHGVTTPPCTHLGADYVSKCVDNDHDGIAHCVTVYLDHWYCSWGYQDEEYCDTTDCCANSAIYPLETCQQYVICQGPGLRANGQPRLAVTSPANRRQEVAP